MRKIVDYISIETFAHATESPEKVLDALLHVVLFKEAVTSECMVGHFGNEIVAMKATLSRSQEVQAFFSSPFIRAVRRQLLESLDRRVDDKGKLFIRADKQDLYTGEYRLDDRGDVRIVAKLLSFPFRREMVIRNAQELLGS